MARAMPYVLLGLLAVGATSATLAVGAPDAAGAAVTFNPVADTYVNSASPSARYGASSLLRVDNSPVKRIFLRFSVSNLTEPVTSAKLRLHVADLSGASSRNGGTLQTSSNSTWSETTVNWNTQPVIDGDTLASLGGVSRNTWHDLDVTSAVTGNGTFSFAMTSTSPNGADYDSSESGANSPQLVVTTGTTATTTVAPGDQVLVGAGDIASCTTSGDEATAALLDDVAGTVFTTGDNAYPNGTSTEFTDCYEPSWGRHQARTRPTAGNHEYNTAGASGYFGYFGTAAGDPVKGYYSYELGAWQVLVVNSNCAAVGGCGAGSEQETWLRAELASSDKACTAAYWHHPLFTSGADHPNTISMRPIFQALYDFNAEVVVTGHNHNYERFAPQDPAGGLDTQRGIREFVAGMGGRSHYGFGTVQPNSEVRNADTYGVLKLTLKANGYDWQFIPEAGKTFTDSGSDSCH